MLLVTLHSHESVVARHPELVLLSVKLSHLLHNLFGFVKAVELDKINRGLRQEPAQKGGEAHEAAAKTDKILALVADFPEIDHADKVHATVDNPKDGHCYFLRRLGHELCHVNKPDDGSNCVCHTKAENGSNRHVIILTKDYYQVEQGGGHAAESEEILAATLI